MEGPKDVTTGVNSRSTMLTMVLAFFWYLGGILVVGHVFLRHGQAGLGGGGLT